MKWISPDLIFLRPVIARRIEDLPAPFAPQIARISPAASAKEMSCRIAGACFGPQVTLRSSSTEGGLIGSPLRA